MAAGDIIWILAPDSAGTCCECNGRIDPCDSCISCNNGIFYLQPSIQLISGIFEAIASSVIPITGGACYGPSGDFYSDINALDLGNIDFGCFTCSKVSNLSLSKYLTGSLNNRNYTTSTFDLTGQIINFSKNSIATNLTILDGVDGNIPIYSPVIQLTPLPLNPTTAQTRPAQITFNYNLSSSASNGLQFSNIRTPVPQYFLAPGFVSTIGPPSPASERGYCLNTPLFPPTSTSIPLIALNILSGDSLNFNFTVEDLIYCQQEIVLTQTTNGDYPVQYSVLNFCGDASANGSSSLYYSTLSLSRLNTGNYEWFSYNNQIFSDQVSFISQQAINVPSTSNILNGPYTILSPFDTTGGGYIPMNEYCGQNFYPSSPQNGKENLLSLGGCGDSCSGCCPNNITQNVIQGNTNFSLKFLTNECVQIGFNEYQKMSINITNSKGIAIDPISRFLAIKIDTGVYNNSCNALP